ncbi:MAG: PAS domain S-box protein [Anaerolineae bacterium]
MPVVIFDGLTLLLALVGATRLARDWRREDPFRDVRRVFVGFLVLLAVISGASLVERLGPASGAAAGAAQYRGYLQLLVPLAAGLMAYVWIQRLLLGELASANAALQRSQQLAAAVTERSPLGLLVVDRDGWILLANQAAADLLGVRRGDLVDRSYLDPTWVRATPAGRVVPRETLVFTRVLMAKQPVLDVPMMITSRDGVTRTVSVSGAPLFDVAGHVEAVTLTLMDITARFRAGQQIARLNAVLASTRQIGRLIMHERNPNRLLQRACDHLVTTRGYRYAWAMWKDGAARFFGSAEEGLEVPLPPQRSWVKDAELPPCVRAALTDDGVHLTGPQACAACSAITCDGGREEDDDWQVASVALRYEGIAYGALVVGVAPEITVDATERELLRGVAGDLAFALHTIEQERACLQAETRLAQQVEAERQFGDRLLALVEVGTALAMTDSLDALYRSAVELAVAKLGFERMGIWLRVEGEPALARGTYGTDEFGRLRDERGRTAKLDADLQGWTRENRPAVLYREEGDLYNDRHAVVGTGSRVRALIWQNGRALGLISIDNLLTGSPITQRDRDLLRLYATMLGSLIARRQAQAEQAEQERFYRTVFETTGTATVVIEDDMTIALANTETARLFGLRKEEIEGKAQISDVVYPDDVALVERIHRLRRSDPQAAPDSYELRLLAGDGSVRNVIVFAKLIPGTGRTVASVVDVTESRRVAERDRRHAAQQSALNAIVGHATQATSLEELLDRSLVTLMSALEAEAGGCWLLGAQAVTGLPPDFIERLRGARGTDVAERARVLDPARPELDDELRAMLEETGMATAVVLGLVSGNGEGGTLRARSPNGDKGDAEAISGTLVLGHRAPHTWTASEIALVEAVGQQLGGAAERLQLLSQVRSQANRLQQVMDTVPEGVVLLDGEGTVLLANSQGRAHLDALCGVGVGDRLTTLGDLPLATLLEPPPLGPWHEVSAEGRTYECVAKPLTQGALPDGWVVVLHDVTEERVTEAQLQQQERLAAVGRLAAGIAHDFNNIIAVIVLYAQMVLRHSGLSDRLRDQLGVISEQAYQATDLVEQILDFSRRSTLTRRPLRLVSYFKEMGRLWTRVLPETIEVALKYEADDLMVEVDPTRLQQVFMNLATNARDAMPGGGRIEIALSQFTLYEGDTPPVATMAPGDWVRIRFSDTGVGIQPEALPHIFEPFYTTKPSGRGAGLGLAQVHGIVKQHGGEVTVHSRPGEGATFTLYFPAVDASTVAPVAASLRGAPAVETVSDIGDGEALLVVEDNPQTREALVAALDGLGYRAIEATNGREALEVLQRTPEAVRAIISDAVMPEMGALDLLAALGEQGHPHPVIVLSGYLPPEKQCQLRDSHNFVTWLTKPVALQDLADAIASALDTSSFPDL